MVERWGLTKDEYLVEKHGVEIPNSNQQLLSPAFSRTLFEPQEDSSKNIKFYLSVAISREENLPKSISKSFQQLDYLFVWNTCAKKKGKELMALKFNIVVICRHKPSRDTFHFQFYILEFQELISIYIFPLSQWNIHHITSLKQVTKSS